MIVYQSNKLRFRQDVETGDIDSIILANYRKALGRGVGDSEVRSWHHSLTHMQMVLNDDEIPGETGVSIELQIPQTSKRIDFVLTGQNDADPTTRSSWSSSSGRPPRARVRTAS